MKVIFYFLFISSLICSGVVSAAGNTDRQIENVLADLGRYEKQIAGGSSVTSNTAKRILKLLGLTRQRLDGVADKASPAWKEADARYMALENQLKSWLKPSRAEQATPAPKNNTTANNTQPTKIPSASAPKEMISQHQIRVKKIKRDVESVFDTMDKAGVKPFQDPKYVQKYQESLDRYKQAIKKYEEFSIHPTVISAKESMAKLAKMIAFGQQQAAKDLAVLGDVQSRLKKIHGIVKKLTMPTVPRIPFKKGEISQWLAELGKIRQVGSQTSKPLPQIQKMAYLPNTRFTVEQTGTYEMDDVNRLDHSLRGIASKIDTDLKNFRDDLQLNIEHVERDLSMLQGYDPAKEEDRLKHFLYEGRAEEIKSRFASQHLVVTEAITFSQRMKNKDLDARKQLLKRVETATTQYQANFNKALSLARMPTPVSTDEELLAIARKALKSSIPPGYDKVGEIKRIVITSKKVHRANDVTHETFDDIDVTSSGNITMSGTAITNHFEWDEYKVVSAEKVGAKHYIYYTSLAYYTEGGQRTKLNQWVITGRLKGAEIPAKNIHLK